MIEVHAYRTLARMQHLPELEREFGGTISGWDVLRYLIEHRVLRKPPCFETGTLGSECMQANPDQSLWLPKPLSGDEDLIFERQFSGSGQQFHFMATPWDLLDDTAAVASIGAPPNMFLAAYPRVLRFLKKTYLNVIDDPALADLEGNDIYTLIHSVCDSYSSAHAVRDMTQKGWPIRYLTTWQITAAPVYVAGYLVGRIGDFPNGLPYLCNADLHHGFPSEHRDTEYLAAGSDAKLPFQADSSLLSAPALKASEATIGILTLVYRVMRYEGTNKFSRTYRDEAWSAFVNAYIPPMPQYSNLVDLTALQRRDPDAEWQPLMQIAAKYRGSTEREMRGPRLLVNYRSRLITTLLPFALAFGFEWQPKGWGGAVSDRIDFNVFGPIALPITSDFTISFSPFIVEFMRGRRPAVEDISSSLLNFQVTYNRIPLFNYIGFEGPRYSWYKGEYRSDYAVSIGSALDFDPLVLIVAGLTPKIRATGTTPPPDATTLAPASASKSWSLIWYPISYQFLWEGRGGFISPGLTAEIVYDRDNNGRRLKEWEFGVLLRGAFNRKTDHSMNVVQAGPTVRWRASGLFWVLTELLLTQSVLHETDQQSYTDVNISLGPGISFGKVDIGIDAVRMRREFAPGAKPDIKCVAGLRFGLAF